MTVDEDVVVEKLLLKQEEKTQSDFNEFNSLDDGYKLQKLEKLVQQSQVFSNIISDTLLQSSLSKKAGQDGSAEAAADGEEPPKKKSKRSRKKNTTEFKEDVITEETKKTKAKLIKQETIKQPSLVTGATMRDYQLEGTEWLITLYENGLNGILADEMGLGKTIQSIALLAFLHEQGIKGPFLITCPLSTVGNWVKEFKKFTPDLPVLGYIGTKDERKELRTNHFHKRGINDDISVVITSYEIILKDFEFLNKVSWKFLIVDEGHRLKNINCKLINNLKRLQTSNRLLLTGTPLQNNLNELWSLLNFILPDIFHDLELFQKWFDFSSLTNLSKTVENDSTKELIDSKIQETLVGNLHTILKPFLLRRLKKNVIKTLPSKREYIIYGTLTKTQSELYKSTLQRSLKKAIQKFAFLEHIKAHNLECTRDEINQFLSKHLDRVYLVEEKEEYGKSYLRSDKEVKYVNISELEAELNEHWIYVNKWVETKALQNMMMQLRLICNSPYLFYFPWEDESSVDLASLIESSSKLQILDQLLPRLLNEDHKVLIFSQFTKMLDLIQDYCELRGWEVSRLDGSVDQEEREVEINKFSDDSEVKIFLLSTRAGGLGLNLTQADTVILFDSDWNPHVDLQAMDRVHRIGQENNVIIYRLILLNTVEQILLAKADSKRKLEKLVIQLGKFESLKKLINTKNPEEKKIKREEKLTRELVSLYEDSRFRSMNNDEIIEDNILSEQELNELLDRSDEAYHRSFDYYSKFKHIQIFETTTSEL